MDHFDVADGVLHADGVDLRLIAAHVGTPCYIYAGSTLKRHIRVMSDALAALPHLICFAVKANGNIGVLEFLSREGASFDAVSGGELVRVAKAGGDLSRTIMSGVGKTDDEIAMALRAGCLYICIESAAELDAVVRVATRIGVVAPVTVRVNPDVDAATHPYISTGLRENKFGVLPEEAERLYDLMQRSGCIDPVGLSCHIGSQITALEPFCDAAKRIVLLARKLLERGVRLSHIGMGGGLGIPYHDEKPPTPALYGCALARLLENLGLTVVLEPGRVIAGNAGILLTRVVRVKHHGERNFAVVDAGMNDLLRPALYGASHQIVAVESSSRASLRYTVVGPVCESADLFARDSNLAELRENDLLAIRSAGAYGFTMASNYNARPRPAEVFCRDGQWQILRKRESYSDMYRGERSIDGHEIDNTLPSFVTTP